MRRNDVDWACLSEKRRLQFPVCLICVLPVFSVAPHVFLLQRSITCLFWSMSYKFAVEHHICLFCSITSHMLPLFTTYIWCKTSHMFALWYHICLFVVSNMFCVVVCLLYRIIFVYCKTSHMFVAEHHIKFDVEYHIFVCLIWSTVYVYFIASQMYVF